MITHWTPSIGDSSALGWFTVGAYLGASALCAFAALSATRRSADFLHDRSVEWHFWLAAFIIFVFLGINKQLDLQLLLTESARNAAKARGWYDQRREYQVAYIMILAVITIAAEIGLLSYYRHKGAPLKLAVIGLGFTGAFVMFRAASFHHVDLLLNRRTFGIRFNWIFELTGIVLVMVAARWYSMKTAVEQSID